MIPSNPNRRSPSGARPATALSVLALLFGAALFILGCGGSQVTYVDPDYGFSFEYNDSWRIVEVQPGQLPPESSKSVGVYDPKGSDAGNDLTFDYMSVDVYEIDADSMPTFETLEEGFLSYLEQLKASDESLRIIDKPTPTGVNGIAALKITYSFLADDVRVRCSEYRLLDARGLVFSLFIQAADETWDLDTEVFTTFLRTFSLGAHI